MPCYRQRGSTCGLANTFVTENVITYRIGKYIGWVGQLS